jgi:ribose transport system permease protein
MVVFSVTTTNFGTLDNFMVILRQTVLVGVATIGMTFVITSGQIDLSIGGVVALGSMTASLALKAGAGLFLSSLLAIVVGIGFGYANGLLIAKVRMPSFLVTLGTSSIAYGIAQTITNQRPVTLFDPNFVLVWGNYMVGPVPMLVIWGLVAFGICYFIYQFTPFGNHIRAVGGNSTAARYSGINTKKVVTLVMLISGVLAGLCALLMSARVNQGRPDVGSTLAMDAITATVLGGTPFSGGNGSLPRAMIGALVLSVLTNALVILGVQTTVQSIIKGVIILIAVAVSDKGR